MELNLTYEGCTLAISAVHERGGRVLAGLLCVLLIVTGCASAVENSWKPCREQPDATMIITADGYVINCLTNPDKAVPRPAKKPKFGSVTQ